MRRVWIGLLLGAIVLSACAPAATPTVPPEKQVVVIYERSGGIAGRSDRWLIYSDGSIVDAQGKGVQVSVEEVNALLTHISNAGFFSWAETYLPEDPCCDRYTHKLTVMAGGKSHSVTTLDGTTGTPPELWTVLEEVQQLVSRIP